MQAADGKTLSMCRKACQCPTTPDKSVQHWVGPGRSLRLRLSKRTGAIPRTLTGPVNAAAAGFAKPAFTATNVAVRSARTHRPAVASSRRHAASSAVARQMIDKPLRSTIRKLIAASPA